MEQHEIDELQAYINLYFKNKKIITMPNNFYVAVKVGSNPAEYVSDINSSGLPVYDTNRDNAVWDETKKPVDDYVTQNNITDVKVQSEGGNRPTKPPLSA